jgi:hypothetical protein
MDLTAEEYKEFKKSFWQWYDSLTYSERKKFSEYPADMAELYFYNKIWQSEAFYVAGWNLGRKSKI